MNKEQQAVADDLKARLLMLVGMLRDGSQWKSVVEPLLRTEARRAYTAMVAAENPHAAAKFMGAFHALSQVADWPAREREIAEKNLQQLLTEG